MTVANVAITNTFDQWRITTNQLIAVVNDIESSSNLIRAQSNSSPLSVSSGVSRGGVLYFDVSTNSSITNASTNVIATSNAINNLYIELRSNVAISGNNYANSVGTAANAYAESIGTVGNTYIDTVVVANLEIANAYSRIFANTKLANTDSVIAGNLTSTQGFADKIGDMRNIPLINKTTSYVLTLSDNGQVISTNGNITVPNTIFFSGNTISVFNNSAANITISNASSVMMYSAGTANVGSRVLQQRGIATVVCIAANTFVITGAGIVP